MTGKINFKSLFLSSLLLAPAFVQAQGFTECKKEAVQFCSSVKEPGETLRCLAGHDADLSAECKDALQRYVQAAKQAASRGGGALGAFGGMTSLTPPVPMAVYEGRMIPGGSGTSLTENKLNLSSPVYGSKVETVSVSLAGSYLHFGDALALDSGTTLAKDWKRAEFGVQYSRRMADKKTWGLRTSVGSASDQFSSKDFTYSLSGFYGFPGEGKGYWILSLYLANNNPIANGIPIPGFLYIYKGENFTGVFGLPVMSLQWTFAEPWAVSLSLFGPIVTSELTYGSVDHYQLFTGFSWNRQSYIPNVRVDDKDRFTIEDKKVTLGVRTPLFWNLTTELQGGRSFNRSLYIGTGLSKSERGMALLPSSLYFGWNLRAAL